MQYTFALFIDEEKIVFGIFNFCFTGTKNFYQK